MDTTGYARCSPAEPVSRLRAQVQQLRAAGCTLIVRETALSSDPARPRLAAAIASLGPGDKLVVTAPDRPACSPADLLRVIGQLTERGAGLCILSWGLDTSDHGSLVTQMTLAALASAVEIEQTARQEREHRAGILGRPPSVDVAAVMQLRAAGVGPTGIARRLGIGRSSVYRLSSLKPSD